MKAKLIASGVLIGASVVLCIAASFSYIGGGGGFDPTSDITFTGTDTFTGTVDMSGATVSLGTLSVLPVTTIELGNPSDTTIARVSAGVISVEGKTIPRIIASGTVTINPGAITSGSVTTAIDGGTATGVLTTDVIEWTPSTDISATTGYTPATTGGLIIYAYPTADHVNFKVGNPTGSSVTPTSITLNWRVPR